MFVALQLVGVAAVPLNVTVLVPFVVPKFAPLIVTEVPTAPHVGLTLEMEGPETGLNWTQLLARPPTVTSRHPAVAPVGTGTVMLVALQFDGDATVP
jgi:hypothetical protein